MDDQGLGEVGRNTGQHLRTWGGRSEAGGWNESLTCQKYEEQPRAVKENELHQQDDSYEPLAVPGHHVVHHEVEHGVEVDGYQAHGNTNDIVEVVETDEVSTGLVSGDEVYDLHAENDWFIEK